VLVERKDRKLFWPLTSLRSHPRPVPIFGSQGSHPPTETTTWNTVCYIVGSVGLTSFVK
jgi:hypothetical protein